MQTTFLALTKSLQGPHQKQVEAILGLSWLRENVGDCYHPTLGPGVQSRIILLIDDQREFAGET
ncbi:MAG: hypothetical protein ACYC6A_21245, partial [Armatimonadota bacterium]